MSTDFLADVLVSPEGAPLHFVADQNAWINAQSGARYEIIDEVPLLLATDANEKQVEITLTNGVRAIFQYVAHYRQDAEVFDYSEEWTDGAAQHENRRLREYILWHVPEQARRILDVGCGSAWVAAHFARQPRTVELVSMDISVTNPRKALQRYPFAGHRAVVADVYALPFREQRFDCIIAAEVMEHTPDPELFLINLLRVLRPGGRLIITIPYNETIAYALCVHCNSPTPHNAHLHTFNRQNLERLLKKAGAVQWKIDTFANKALLRLRTHILLKFLPFGIWRRLDQLANTLYPKPARALICITKPEQ